jgi:hypothetical protein
MGDRRTTGAWSRSTLGKVLETYRAEDDGDDGYISEIEVLRGDFSMVLYEDTRADVCYVFGDRIAGLTQDADGVGLRELGPAGPFERRSRPDAVRGSTPNLIAEAPVGVHRGRDATPLGKCG